MSSGRSLGVRAFHSVPALGSTRVQTGQSLYSEGAVSVVAFTGFPAPSRNLKMVMLFVIAAGCGQSEIKVWESRLVQC